MKVTWPGLCLRTGTEQLNSSAQGTLGHCPCPWYSSEPCLQFERVLPVRRAPREMAKTFSTSTRPQMSFVSADALKSVDFRKQQYGPLINGLCWTKSTGYFCCNMVTLNVLFPLNQHNIRRYHSGSAVQEVDICQTPPLSIITQVFTSIIEQTFMSGAFLLATIYI